MTNKEKDLLNTFEARLRHLLFLYENLKKENEDLKMLLNEEQRKNSDIEHRFKDLQNDYTRLKTALIINPNRKDIKETKDRITKLVREVDECIALLDV